MSTQITAVDAGSPAEKAGIHAGQTLVSINGHRVRDVLDYKFYGYDSHLSLVIADEKKEKKISLHKMEGQDLGLSFDTYLMDAQRGCANRCVFCFIDQLPEGMRSSLYFKDDDARMSFLLGNYISMTNLSEEDVRRIIAMRISPLNISVHTTNPQLREKMLGNPRGGESLKYLEKFVEAGLRIQAQIVVCPGWNDGEELRRTLEDLGKMHPAVVSVAVVPVGLTKHRCGLEQLRPVTKQDALDTLEIIDAARQKCRDEHGDVFFYAADEFYLKAGLPYPPEEYYGDYPQLENGVGLFSMFEQELRGALSLEEEEMPAPSPFVVATGMAAAPFMQKMLDKIRKKCPGLCGEIIAVKNEFFGEGVDVAGLLTGGDLIAALKGKMQGRRLLLPQCMLRHGETVFLDDVSLEDLSRRLQCPVTPVEVEGFAFLDAVMQREAEE